LLAKKVTDPHTAKAIAKLHDNVTQIEVGALKSHTHEEQKHNEQSFFSLTEYVEAKEVIKDILPNITPKNFEFIEFLLEEDFKAFESREAMNSWLANFFAEVKRVDKFFQDQLKDYIQEFVTLQAHCLRKCNSGVGGLAP
jgi:DNA-binding response OmpR family regulator